MATNNSAAEVEPASTACEPKERGGGGGTPTKSSQQQQSPRNTAGGGGGAMTAVSSSVGSTNNCPYVQMGAIEVPKALQDGEKFIKWDEESGIGTPVTLRVDPKGFFLYWADQNNEIDLLDIALIRDVRTGPYAKKPRDIKLRQIVTMGSVDTLEQKTVTLCYSTDFVNVTFINFCCTRRDIAQVWTDELMKLTCNMIQQNGSTTFYLQKAHTKLCLQVDKSGKIPVKSIIKLFASSKDDRRRVEKALDVSGLPSGKGELLPLSKFQFEDFFNLYKNLTQRSEVEKIFDELVGASKRRLMSTSQLVEFLNMTQRDPRLNEILYPYANPARARDIITEYEPNKFNAQKGQLSLDGFLRYLMSENNPIMAVNKLDICDDMDQPLAHYFINSSHNTYLTGHQLTGKSSVEIYRQSLLADCRCVELDFWNGKLEEPIIVHGYTFVPEITARDVLEAIAESAFKTSEYPVILSFENHCNPRQQAKIANYCREIFGDMLLDKPLESHPLEPSVDLPPPSMLKRKIIIKNKKKHHHHHHGKRAHLIQGQQQQQQQQQQPVAEEGAVGINNPNDSPQKSAAPMGNGDIAHAATTAPPLQQIRQGSVESTGSSDTDSSSEDESLPTAPTATDPRDKGKETKETEAGAEISALVNYVQPIHFSSFENAEKKMKCYEMSSFDEKQATTLLKERPIEFVNYNKHQLSRVYPAGTRFDSSNFMPQLFWNAGCQLVALNYQTMDLAMQLNQGIFEYNRRSGYLLKPEFMRRNDRRLDPFAESTVDGIIAGTVSITVLSGQFLTDKKIGTYVEVDMYGLPADTVRKRFRTKIVRENGVNPVYGEEPFVFKKVVLPELASVRITAYEESGKFIGHRVLPVIGLCPGYRHVNLRNELGQPLLLATLFLCIVVKDYVPDGLSDFAEALANPIKYQSELDKRAEQLAVLTEDTEPIPEDDSICETSAAGARPSKNDTLPRGQKSSIDVVENGAESATGGGGVISGGSGGPINVQLHQQQSHLSTTISVTSQSAGGGGGSSGLGAFAQSGSQSTVASLATSSQQYSGSAAAVASSSTSVTNDPSSTASTSGGGGTAKSSEAIEADAMTAEPLESILGSKAIREKRQEMEKKLESLRKKHDKEKLRICSSPKSGESSEKKSKFNMGNKLVKRLSSKNIDPTLQVPPCPSELLDVSEEGEDEDRPNITRSHSERLLTVCREYGNTYREIQEKYHESIYNTADKLLRNSQANQMKRLKTLLEKETSDVMRKLQVDRRNEVKALTQKHRDRDELVRMKREVASSLVERGVTERLRLAQAFEKRREDLQRQHELVKTALQEHRAKAKTLIEKDTESRSCVGTMDGFLVLFDSAVLRSANSTSLTVEDGGNSAMSESHSASAICLS